MKEVVLHIGDELPKADAIRPIRPLVESLGARLHVVHTVSDPLSAGWQSEMHPKGMPDLHQAMAAEAREMLSQVFGAAADQANIVIRTGPAVDELARYVEETPCDMIVVGIGSDDVDDLASALLEKTKCSVLAWRK